ncbi:hypothetical protein [Streptomyces sp. CO7]
MSDDVQEAVRRRRRRAAAECLAERAARGEFEPTRRMWEARKAARRVMAAELEGQGEGAE